MRLNKAVLFIFTVAFLLSFLNVAGATPFGFANINKDQHKFKDDHSSKYSGTKNIVADSNDWAFKSQDKYRNYNFGDHKPKSKPGSYSVPEPATMILLGFGLIGLAGFGRKRVLKKKKK